MIVFKSPFPRDITPWSISKFLLFWDRENDDRIEKLGDYLAFGEGGRQCMFDGKSKLSVFEFNDVLDKQKNRYETPLYKLLQLINSKINKIDYVKVHDYDVWNGDETLLDIIYPVLLAYKKSMNGSPNVDDEDVPENLRSGDSFDKDIYVHEKWAYVVDEMLFSFNPKNNSLYTDGEIDKVLNKRMENGRILFGKYMTSLWT